MSFFVFSFRALVVSPTVHSVCTAYIKGRTPVSHTKQVKRTQKVEVTATPKVKANQAMQPAPARRVARMKLNIGMLDFVLLFCDGSAG